MRRRIKYAALAALLLIPLVVWAQYQPWAVQWMQHANTAQNARAYLGVDFTNGYPLFQLSKIPTNSIPRGSPGVTNWVLCNVTNYGPILLATNTAAGGYQKITFGAPSAL
jgi:hypothetical protein